MNKVLILGGAGYIGSYLKKVLKEKDYFVQSVDLGLFNRGFDYDGNIPTDYRNLSKTYIELFDTVVLLAAHSSVKMAMSNPYGAFKNNVEGFVDLLENKINYSQQLIYASSSSVYNDQYEAKEVDEWFRPNNIYDLTKYEMDMHTKLSDKQVWGLRLGTVNGWSPYVRTDLMMNKMFYYAMKDAEIRITNPKIQRPILHINEFADCVLRIMELNKNPGIYNLSSFNASVEEMAEAVQSRFTHVDIKNEPGMTSYNFTIDSTKARETFLLTRRYGIEDVLNSFRNPLERWGVRDDEGFRNNFNL